MRNHITILAILFASLLTGCTSTSELGRPDKEPTPLPPDLSLHVFLKEGAELALRPFHYVVVEQPADMIYGRGKAFNLRTGKTRYFAGTVPGVEPLRVAPVRTQTDKGWYPASIYKQQSVFALSDSEEVGFLAGDFLTVHAEQGAGFFCVGTRTANGDDAPFEGRVPFEDILRIETEETNWVGTGILAGVGTACFFVMVMMLPSLDFDYNIGYRAR